MTRRIPGKRKRGNRVVVFFNDAEIALLEKLVRHYQKRTKDQLLTTPLIDRSKIIRYMVVKAGLGIREAK